MMENSKKLQMYSRGLFRISYLEFRAFEAKLW